MHEFGVLTTTYLLYPLGACVCGVTGAHVHVCVSSGHACVMCVCQVGMHYVCASSGRESGCACMCHVWCQVCMHVSCVVSSVHACVMCGVKCACMCHVWCQVCMRHVWECMLPCVHICVSCVCISTLTSTLS